MQARGGRQVPVGYSAADVREILVSTSNYLQCTIGGTTASDYINGGRSDVSIIFVDPDSGWYFVY